MRSAPALLADGRGARSCGTPNAEVVHDATAEPTVLPHNTLRHPVPIRALAGWWRYATIR